jgi:hypothetical protein
MSPEPGNVRKTIMNHIRTVALRTKEIAQTLLLYPSVSVSGVRDTKPEYVLGTSTQFTVSWVSPCEIIIVSDATSELKIRSKLNGALIFGCSVALVCGLIRARHRCQALWQRRSRQWDVVDEM